MKFVIVEDELPAARGLSELIQQVVPEAVPLGILSTKEAAILWFKENETPDIAFFDIQLKNELSFEIFQSVSVKCPVIFCTAYNQYAIQAFQSNGIDYLLKPIKLDDVKRSIEKLRNLKDSFQSPDEQLFQKLERLITDKQGPGKQRFLVRAGRKLFHVDQESIAYIYIANKVVHVVTHDNRKFHMDQNLEELEEQLSSRDFFRINRQFIVSIRSVVKVENDYGAYHIHLNPPISDTVTVSKYRLDRFKSWMDGEF